MNTDRKMNATTRVTIWRPQPSGLGGKRRADRPYLSPVVIGLIGTVLLHSLFLPPILLGSTGQRIRLPEVPEIGAALTNADIKSTEALVIFELPRFVTSDYEFRREMAFIGARQPVLQENIRPHHLLQDALHLDINDLADDRPREDSAVPAEHGSSAERTRLIGIYTRQVQARIERIWLRPRSSVRETIRPSQSNQTDEPFICQVQIVQDATGNVREVLLPRCNGTPVWQRSLVMAINQSSPLPAPPSPSVFSNTMTLNFLSSAYAPGTSADGYASDPATAEPAVMPAKYSNNDMSGPSPPPPLPGTFLRDR